MPKAAERGTPVLDEVFALILRLDGIKPHPSLPKRLGPLLKDLQRPIPSRDPTMLAELIHAVWISSDHPQALAGMAKAITAIDEGDAGKAGALLDDLEQLAPFWAEVFYKRAIVALMTHRPNDALLSLGQTLQLEPRHFAAVSLFGQICLDVERFREARIALAKALDMNPHLKGLTETIESISERLEASHHRLHG